MQLEQLVVYVSLKKKRKKNFKNWFIKHHPSYRLKGLITFIASKNRIQKRSPAVKYDHEF